MTAVVAPQADAPAVPGTSFRYRPALDGIRALAVVAVLLYHLDLPWVPGGFLGVDAFFVLSGYLITSLLLVEHARHGRISLPAFWARRARRLLPPMLVLVAAVGVWALRADAEVRASLRDDALSAIAYVANWRFVLSGQSYFDEFTDPSPLRHTWSLAIEEQFYLVWPLVVVLCLWLARRRAWLLGVVAVVAGAASVVAMAVLAPGDPSRAYYGTDARIHEMLVGVLLAVLVQRGLLREGGPLDRRPLRRWWRLLATLSLVAVVGAVLVVPDWATAYYRGGSLVFSLAVAGLILGLERGGDGGLAPDLLSRRAVVWVGTVSYGLYLYHWPVFLWLDSSVVPLDGLALDALRLVVTVGVSVVSYHLLEMPVRHGSGPLLSTPGRTLLTSGTAMLLVAGLVWGLHRDAAPPVWADGEVGDVVVVGEDDPGALTVAVAGDSIAKSMLPGLDAAAKEQGVRVVAAAWSGCGYAGTFQVEEDLTTPFEFSEACADAVPERYLDMVREYDPEVVLLHSVRDRLPMRPAEGGEVVDFATPEHDALVLDGLGASIDALASEGATVLVSRVVHRAQRFKGTCSEPENAGRCAADDGSDGVYDHINTLVERAVVENPGSRVYGLDALMCPDGPPCPTRVPGSDDIVRWDGSHLSEPGTEYFGPLILDDLVEAAAAR